MKKFIAGLIFGLIIATSVVGLANSEITAKFANFNLVIDGETKQLETQPLVYNGTSYLPLRELSNLVGYDVDYQGTIQTIFLTSNKDVKTTTSPNENEKAETPKKETYKISDEITIGNAKITIKSIKYSERHDTLIAGTGNHFAIVNAEILMTAPSDGLDWNSINFVRAFHTVNGKTLNQVFSTGDNAIVKQNEISDVQFSIELNEGDRVAFVIVVDPTIRDLSAKVLIN